MILSLTRDQLYYRHQMSHDQIDDILGERRVGDYPESKAQHLGKLNAFLQVCDLFKKAGVIFIPQKGPILSLRLRGDPLYRSFTDLDFFVKEEQVLQAVNLLMKNGFRTPFYTLPGNKCKRKLLYKHVNEIILLHDEWSVTVELHWSFFNCRIINEKDFAMTLEENLDSILFEGHTYVILSKELELLYLVIHGTLHGWWRLKWLLDIWIYLQTYQLDESRFVTLVQQFGARRPVAVCNELLKIYFPGKNLLPSSGETPSGMFRFALRQIRQPVQEKGIFNFLGFLRNSWRAFPGILYKIDLLKRTLFATDLASVSWMPCSALAFYIISPVWKLLRGFRV